MSTIIVNGLPKVNLQIVTHSFSQKSLSNMKNPSEIRRIAGSDYNELAQYIRSFDAIIFYNASVHPCHAWYL